MWGCREDQGGGFHNSQETEVADRGQVVEMELLGIQQVCWRESGWDSGMNWKGLVWREKAECGTGHV